jgi:excisionase family DNA binding protein
MSDKPSEEDLDKVLNLEERLYAPVEIAYILKLQVATIQELCRTKRMLAIKVNNQWRITKAEVKRYIEEGPYKGERE